MTQLRGKRWSLFMLEAEFESFGHDRIVSEHNSMLSEFVNLHDLLHKANSVFIPSNDNANTEIAKALSKTSEFLP